MTADATLRPEAALEAEWERLELLAHCLAEGREGRGVSEESLARLRALQARVRHLRNGCGAWAGLSCERLPDLELDVLACAVGPEIVPSLGNLFQALQPGSAQPYPSLALIQELLALDGEGAQALHRALAPGAVLRRMGLVRFRGENPYQPVKPGAGVTARLLGRPDEFHAPPGTVRVTMTPEWQDLVLPEDRVVMLRELLLWVRHRDVVFGRWGARDCGGPVALFSGPSGTGKTFAGAVVAHELGWPLFRVDLGVLVSKYIGETEENLNRLFDFAHGRRVVLQFDEADSLFSKRGEVKEARDRYANMEVSHLLTRIESHRGPCILTTNLRGNLDTAFSRRFQVVVDFPRPDVAARIRLWQTLLPPRAPRADDLDLEFLGRTANLTGGGIRNAALHAAFLAAGRDGPIRLADAALGVWREMSKGMRHVKRTDLGALCPYLPEEVR